MNLTLSQAVSHFGRIAVMTETANQTALEYAANYVLKTIKSIPGEYQSGAGPFPAWAPLAQSTLDDKARKGFPVPSPLLRTGEMRDSYQKTVGVNKAWVGSNNDKAVWQELGTSKIPPRSVIGMAGAQSAPHIVETTGRIMYGLLTSGNVKIPV